MLKQALTNFPFLSLTVFGLFLFLTVFISMLFWVFRSSGKPIYQHLQTLPLDEELS